MILDAYKLSLWRCERLGQFSREWRPARQRPRSLFNSLLRAMVSHNASTDGVTASTVFLEKARDPGLEIIGSPYEIAQDYAYALRHVAEWLSRTVLLTIKSAPLVRLTDSFDWLVTAFQSEDGMLHRWTSADRVDEDWLSREFHSWAVLGDCLAANAPMMLHVVETGSMRHGHLYGPWTRVFQHPSVIGRYQFQKTDGTALAGEWKQRWAQDLKFSPKEWVDLMQRDRVEPIRHVAVKVPEEFCREQWIRQLEEFLPRMAVRKDPMLVLGNPSICDSPLGACQFQACCYPPTDPEKAGGFVRVGSQATARDPSGARIAGV